MLCLHSLGTDRRSWNRVTPPLTNRGYRVVRPDAWGHGQSKAIAREEPIDWVRDVIAVLDDAGIDRADLVGVSMGAAQALDVALRHPDRVGRIVIAGAFGTLSAESAAAKVEALVGGAQEHGMTEWAARYVESTLVTTDPRARSTVEVAVRATPLTAYAAMARTCFQPRAGDLTSLARPVHVLWGALDRKTPRSFSEELVATLPTAQLTVLPGVGHLPHVDAPDAFADHVLGDLRADRGVVPPTMTHRGAGT